MKKKYETLQQFIAGYFHQDWDLEGSSDLEIARLFANKDSVSAKIVVTEIDDLIEEAKEKPDIIDCKLKKFGCEYRYNLDFSSGKEWLNRIKDIIKDSI